MGPKNVFRRAFKSVFSRSSSAARKDKDVAADVDVRADPSQLLWECTQCNLQNVLSSSTCSACKAPAPLSHLAGVASPASEESTPRRERPVSWHGRESNVAPSWQKHGSFHGYEAPKVVHDLPPTRSLSTLKEFRFALDDVLVSFAERREESGRRESQDRGEEKERRRPAALDIDSEQSAGASDSTSSTPGTPAARKTIKSILKPPRPGSSGTLLCASTSPSISSSRPAEPQEIHAASPHPSTFLEDGEFVRSPYSSDCSDENSWDEYEYDDSFSSEEDDFDHFRVQRGGRTYPVNDTITECHHDRTVKLYDPKNGRVKTVKVAMSEQCFREAASEPPRRLSQDEAGVEYVIF